MNFFCSFGSNKSFFGGNYHYTCNTPEANVTFPDDLPFSLSVEQNLLTPGNWTWGFSCKSGDHVTEGSRQNAASENLELGKLFECYWSMQCMRAKSKISLPRAIGPGFFPALQRQSFYRRRSPKGDFWKPWAWSVVWVLPIHVQTNLATISNSNCQTPTVVRLLSTYLIWFLVLNSAF